MTARRFLVLMVAMLYEGRDADGIAEIDAMLDVTPPLRAVPDLLERRMAALSLGGEIA